MIKYALYPNHLTDDPDDYMAVVQDQPVKNEEDLINDVIDRGSNVNKAEALAALEEIGAAVVRAWLSGAIVQLDLVRIFASIQGKFASKDSPFNPKEHQVVINVQLGKRLIQIPSQIPVERVAAKESKPVIESVYDWGSDTQDTTLTPGSALEINGKLLKLTGALETEGVFFIKQADGSETQATRVRANLPSELTVLVPQLAKGKYRVEVRNAYRSTNRLKAGLFATLLTVS